MKDKLKFISLKNLETYHKEMDENFSVKYRPLYAYGFDVRFGTLKYPYESFTLDEQFKDSNFCAYLITREGIKDIREIVDKVQNQKPIKNDYEAYSNPELVGRLISPVDNTGLIVSFYITYSRDKADYINTQLYMKDFPSFKANSSNSYVPLYMTKEIGRIVDGKEEGETSRFFYNLKDFVEDYFIGKINSDKIFYNEAPIEQNAKPFDISINTINTNTLFDLQSGKCILIGDVYNVKDDLLIEKNIPLHYSLAYTKEALTESKTNIIFDTNDVIISVYPCLPEEIERPEYFKKTSYLGNPTGEYKAQNGYMKVKNVRITDRFESALPYNKLSNKINTYKHDRCVLSTSWGVNNNTKSLKDFGYCVDNLMTKRNIPIAQFGGEMVGK